MVIADLEKELRASLLDDFSQKVLTGALCVIEDKINPLRLNLFAAAIRELFSHTLHTLAPDNEVTKCGWFKLEPNTQGPTRRQRAKYAAQGGLSDDYVESIGVDLDDLHSTAIRAIEKLNKYTHVRPGTIVDAEDAVEQFVGEALDAHLGLFASFSECRDSVTTALYDHIDDEVVAAFISETLQNLDEMASHYFIDEVSIGEISITKITAEQIKFKVSGSLGVQFQYGSGSDLRSDMGAVLDETFPFEVTMNSPVAKVTAFQDVSHSIDTRSWHE